MVGSELPTPETRESTVTDEVALAVDGLTRRRTRRCATLLDDVVVHASTAARSSASPVSRATARAS